MIRAEPEGPALRVFGERRGKGQHLGIGIIGGEPGREDRHQYPETDEAGSDHRHGALAQQLQRPP